LFGLWWGRWLGGGWDGLPGDVAGYGERGAEVVVGVVEFVFVVFGVDGGWDLVAGFEDVFDDIDGFAGFGEVEGGVGGGGLGGEDDAVGAGVQVEAGGVGGCQLQAVEQPGGVAEIDLAGG